MNLCLPVNVMMTTTMTNTNYSSDGEYYLFKYGYVLPEHDFLKLKQELTFIINQILSEVKK